MTIDALPSAPNATTDSPANFSLKATAFAAALPNLVSQVNLATQAMNLNSTSDISASSVAIGTGAKTFTVSAGKSFLGGMFLVIADTSAPSTNWMFGQVTSYSGTSLVMNITAVGGSGTKTAWTISQSAAGTAAGAVVASLGANTFTGLQTFATGASIASAATINLSSATGNTVHVTGTTAISAVTMNAGQWMELIFDAACPLTYNATTHKLNTGGSSYTCAAGDNVFYFYDGSIVYGFISKADGTVVSPNLATNSDYQTGTDSSKPLTSSVARARNIVAGTLLATTSGTSQTFTGIPTWAKRVTVQVAGFSTSGTSDILLRIGAGSIVSTGYLSSTAVVSGAATNSTNFTTGFSFTHTTGVPAAGLFHGQFVLTLIDPATNKWICTGALGRSDATANYMISGSIALSGNLDRVSITSANGTDTADGGVMNIFWE